MTENDEMLERMIGPNYKDKYTFLALIGNIDFKTGQTNFEVVPYMKGLPIEVTKLPAHKLCYFMKGIFKIMA